MRARFGYLMVMLILAVAVGCSSSKAPASRPDRAWHGATIVIGIDALRWDYPERFGLHAIGSIGERGVRAGALIPVFPTKTFPNFYTLATGLFPNHTGILENTMYDPDLDSKFRMGDTTAVRDARWWGGEPIWVTAEKQGHRSAVFFWPGSEAAIEGRLPTYWEPYDGSIEGINRVDQVLSWLSLPERERPDLILVYFSDVDETAHRYGPVAPETRKAAEEVDDLVAQLLSGLKERDIIDLVNVVVVSDHGMSSRSQDRVIFLDDYVDVRSSGVLSLGEFVTLWPQPNAVDSVYLALAKAHPALKVYRRDNLPSRFHLAGHRRTPPIIGVPAPGWSVSTHDWVNRHPGQPSGGGHGYDNAESNMRAVFVAAGPAFRRSVRIEAIQAVDVYDLLAFSLGLLPAPNDGDPTLVPRLMKPH